MKSTYVIDANTAAQVTTQHIHVFYDLPKLQPLFILVRNVPMIHTRWIIFYSYHTINLKKPHVY